MNKDELIETIAKKTGESKAATRRVIDAYLETVRASLAKNDAVHIRGFGSYIVKKRAKRVARDINKNRAIVIPEHHVPAFRPADSFVKRVRSKVKGRRRRR